MNFDELISTEELCTRYRVEHTFISSLGESGLIEVIQVEQKEYVHCDNLGDFEKLHRLHYDLEINLEGIAAIQHLLRQVEKLQKKNRKLRNRLRLYEGE